MSEATQQQVTFIPTLPKLEEYLFKIAEPGDLIMTVGAAIFLRSVKSLLPSLREVDNDE